MINNYELLILNYIFNALHDFNSHHSINIGTLGLINLKWNRKVSIPGAAGDLAGLRGEGVRSGMGAGTAALASLYGGKQPRMGCNQWGGWQRGVSEPAAPLFWGWGKGKLRGAAMGGGASQMGSESWEHLSRVLPAAPHQGG